MTLLEFRMKCWAIADVTWQPDTSCVNAHSRKAVRELLKLSPCKVYEEIPGKLWQLEPISRREVR